MLVAWQLTSATVRRPISAKLRAKHGFTQEELAHHIEIGRELLEKRPGMSPAQRFLNAIAARDIIGLNGGRKWLASVHNETKERIMPRFNCSQICRTGFLVGPRQFQQEFAT
jgi:hypothetical protein